MTTNSTEPITRLIVNADDFGLAPGVNRAIIELYQAGAISSASVMIAGKAAPHALELARANPGLEMGVHVVLVDGKPISDASKLPTLAPGGKFRDSVTAFGLAVQRGRIDPEEIERETYAQIRKTQVRGFNPTHVDTHKHAHMFPVAARAVMQASLDCGINMVRNPFEPGWSSREAIGCYIRRSQVAILRLMRKRWLQIAQDLKICTTHGTIGIAATGALDETILKPMLKRMPPGNWELVCHPGFIDAALDKVNTTLLSSREFEHRGFMRILADTGMPRLSTFADLPGAIL